MFCVISIVCFFISVNSVGFVFVRTGVRTRTCIFIVLFGLQLKCMWLSFLYSLLLYYIVSVWQRPSDTFL